MTLGKETFSSIAGAVKTSQNVQVIPCMLMQMRTKRIGLQGSFRKFCNVALMLKASTIFNDFNKMQETQRVKLTLSVSTCWVWWFSNVKACAGKVEPMTKEDHRTHHQLSRWCHDRCVQMVPIARTNRVSSRERVRSKIARSHSTSISKHLVLLTEARWTLLLHKRPWSVSKRQEDSVTSQTFKLGDSPYYYKSTPPWE